MRRLIWTVSSGSTLFDIQSFNFTYKLLFKRLSVEKEMQTTNVVWNLVIQVCLLVELRRSPGIATITDHQGEEQTNHDKQKNNQPHPVPQQGDHNARNNHNKTTSRTNMNKARQSAASSRNATQKKQTIPEPTALTLSVPNFRRHLSSAFVFGQTITWKDVYM